MSSKETIKKLLGTAGTAKVGTLLYIFGTVKAYTEDMIFFLTHSSAVKHNTQRQLETQIILCYHGIEKGFLHIDSFRPKFGKLRLLKLFHYLDKYEEKGYPITSQIQATYDTLVYYYELHERNGVDISDFFSRDRYESAKRFAKNDEPFQFLTVQDLLQFRDCEFARFANSRHSIREFNSTPIANEEIAKVVALANQATSACNRQEVFVRLINNEKKCHRILSLQNGFNGFEKNIHQVIVLTASASYTVKSEERIQFYIDGGIYLQQLLLSLHYHGIGACPGHSAVGRSNEKEILSIAGAKADERLVCIIVVGHYPDKMYTTASHRRPISETLFIED